GPGDAPPENLLEVPDAVPKIEAPIPRANRPYVVFGRTYTPIADDRPFKQRGVGSWYGRKFHGQKTSSGELYDMYAMTAAHPTLPIPSYARVTNLKTGAQVIVRINDRGPFLSNRIIDLSYTAALKLGYLTSGSSELEVERLLPDEITRMAAARRDGASAAATPANPTSPASPAAPVVEAVPVIVGAASGDAALPAIETVAVTQPAVAQDALPANLVPVPVPVVAGAAPAAPLSVPAVVPVVVPAVVPAAGPAVAPIPASPSAIASPGFYLQFGAYAREENATAARGRLLPKLAGTVAGLDALPSKGLYRLVAGPYASRDAAQEAARLVRQKTALAPFVIER
ncbi:MAG: septal ring lytic transglycosylase RlpA family protein, partial [Burkholderiaceae bacterium]